MIDDKICHFDFNSAAKEPKPSSLASTEKWKVFSRLIKNGTVCVVFDTSFEQVKIPQRFYEKPILALNFCYQFHIPDFNFNDVGVWATLSFPKDKDCFCFVPWKAVLSVQTVTNHQESSSKEMDSEKEQQRDAKVVPLKFDS